MMSQTILEPLDVPQARRWSRREYYALTESGYFNGERVELIEGEIVKMPAQNEPHSWTVMLLTRQLNLHMSMTHILRVQLPLALGQVSDPEPDASLHPLSVLTGPMTRPVSADLVVEVSDSSLIYDQTVKQALYAENKIPEYWIINLIGRQLEVFRSPNPATKKYAEPLILRTGQTISPICCANAVIQVKDILP